MSELNNPYPQASIVICDDSITNTLILAKLLESAGFGQVTSFTDPRQLVQHLEKQAEALDLLLLDLEMPHISGLEILGQLQARYQEQCPFQIIVITGSQGQEVRHRALRLGANDFVGKPFDQEETLLRVRNILRVQRALRFQSSLAQHLEQEVQTRTSELNEAVDTLIHRMALAGEMRDNETGLHVARVGRLSGLLAQAIGLPPEISYMIEKAAPLHDVGKIGIPDRILLKQGGLDDSEREEMNLHTQKGAELLGEHQSLLIQMAASIAYSHHEKWDGSGYPRQLKGESIPIEGRIVAIADVFDALTMSRPYKEAWSADAAFNYLAENSGRHFDPTLVEVALSQRIQMQAIVDSLRDQFT